MKMRGCVCLTCKRMLEPRRTIQSKLVKRDESCKPGERWEGSHRQWKGRVTEPKTLRYPGGRCFSMNRLENFAGLLAKKRQQPPHGACQIAIVDSPRAIRDRVTGWSRSTFAGEH